MRGSIEDLYDYDGLRKTERATIFVAHVQQPTLVLGGSQGPDVVDLEKLDEVALRRRRGGGGLVLLRPDDVWIDWWIPSTDPRWSQDVRVSSVQVGAWWAEALGKEGLGDISVHSGPLEGAPEHRVICFAGRGPGEVFVEDRKAVGVTQWRVREGIFVSSVLPAHSSEGMVRYLKSDPAGLSHQLDHQTTRSLGIDNTEELVARLHESGGTWCSTEILIRA